MTVALSNVADWKARSQVHQIAMRVEDEHDVTVLCFFRPLDPVPFAPKTRATLAFGRCLSVLDDAKPRPRTLQCRLSLAIRAITSLRFTMPTGGAASSAGARRCAARPQMPRQRSRSRTDRDQRAGP